MPDLGQQVIDSVRGLNPVDKVSNAVQSAADKVKAVIDNQGSPLARAMQGHPIQSNQGAAISAHGDSDEPAVLIPQPSATAKFTNQYQRSDTESFLRDYYQKHPEMAAADPVRAKRLGVEPPPAQPQQPQSEPGANPEQLAPGQQPKSRAGWEQEQEQIEGRGGSEAAPATGLIGEGAAKVGEAAGMTPQHAETMGAVVNTAVGIVGMLRGAPFMPKLGGYIFDETAEQLAFKEANIREGAVYPEAGARKVEPEAMYTTGTEAPGKQVGPHAAKPLHEMSPDELEEAHVNAATQETEQLRAITGWDGDKLQTYRRLINSESERAFTRAQSMERELSPEQQTALEKWSLASEHEGEHNPTDVQGFKKALGDVETESPEAMGDSLKYAITKLSNAPDNPAEMTTAQQMAYAQVRHAGQVAQDNGWDLGTISNAAVKGAAERFSDPEDARFMLEKYLRPKPAQAEALPGPAPVGPQMTGKELQADTLPTAQHFEKLQENPAVAPAAKQTAAQLEPAIKDLETGEVYNTAKNHGEVYEKMPDEAKNHDLDTGGFLHQGEYVSRKEALNRIAKAQDQGEAQPESVGAAALAPKRDMAEDLTVAHTMPDIIARAKETPLSKEEFLNFKVNNEPEADHITLTEPVTTHDAIRMSLYTEQAVGDLQSAAKMATNAGGSDTALNAAFEQHLTHVRDEVLPRWLGMRHQVGMALRALGKPISNFRDAVLNARDLIGQVDESQPGQLMRALSNLNAKQQSKLLRQSAQAGFWQHLTTLMRAAKLSPGTAIKKTASDLMMLLYTPIERGVATVINQIPGVGDQSMSVGQWLAMMHGYAKAIPKSRELAAASERADTPLFDQQMAFAGAAHQALGSKGTSLEGTWLGWAYDMIANFVHEQGGRRIIYPDQFAKNMHYQASMYAQAMEAAEREGGAQGYSAAAYKHFLENPTEEMQQRAYDDARARTFSNSLQSLKPLGKLLSTTPAGKATFPFVTTPVNLMSFGLQNTPLAPLSRTWQRMFMAGGAERSTALARMTIGTGLAWAITHLWMEGRVRGDLSDNTETRKLQINEGHQPNSISMGDFNTEMGNLPEPWGQVLSQVTNAAQLFANMPVDYNDPEHSVRAQQAENIGSALVLSLAQMVHETSYFRTLSDMINLIGTDKTPVENRAAALGKLGADIVTPAIVEDIAHWWDPVKREIGGMIDQFKDNIPGWSKSLPPQLDMFGRPVTYRQGSSFLNMGLSATAKMTSVDKDPVSDELIRLNHPMPLVPKALGGPARGPMSKDSPKYGEPLSPEERAAFTKLRGHILTDGDGNNLHDALADRMSQPDYKAANDILRAKMIDEKYTQFQGMAREWMMNNTKLPERLERRQQMKGEMLGVQ